MKKLLFLFYLLPVILFSNHLLAQNVGIGTTTPTSKLHIKGSADTWQLTIDANATQTNAHPLIRLRNAAGVDLLHINSDDVTNIFIGVGAGSANLITTGGFGKYNAFIGASAGASNTSGNGNTAIGPDALFSGTTGSNNTGNGFGALYNNLSGSYNTASGFQALYNNSTADGNTANGSQALFYNTSGTQNVANGYAAMQNNTTGSFNTANGYGSLLVNTTGDYNTAAGLRALSGNITGSSNTAIGDYALSNLIGGSKNIAIGDNSGIAEGSPNVTNTISIGNDGYLNAADNQAFIGNLSTAWIGGNVNWSTFSDARIKTNIKEDVKGLDFIMKLRPVTYSKSMDGIAQLTGNRETAEFASKHDADKMLQSGFLAQEVEQAAKDVNYDFSGLHVPANSKQLYSLSYSEFVVPLVKAIQEQQKMIEELKKEIELLKQKIK